MSEQSRKLSREIIRTLYSEIEMESGINLCREQLDKYFDKAEIAIEKALDAQIHLVEHWQEQYRKETEYSRGLLLEIERLKVANLGHETMSVNYSGQQEDDNRRIAKLEAELTDLKEENKCLREQNTMMNEECVRLEQVDDELAAAKLKLAEARAALSQESKRCENFLAGLTPPTGPYSLSAASMIASIKTGLDSALTGGGAQ